MLPNFLFIATLLMAMPPPNELRYGLKGFLKDCVNGACKPPVFSRVTADGIQQEANYWTKQLIKSKPVESNSQYSSFLQEQGHAFKLYENLRGKNVDPVQLLNIKMIAFMHLLEFYRYDPLQVTIEKIIKLAKLGELELLGHSVFFQHQEHDPLSFLLPLKHFVKHLMTG